MKYKPYYSDILLISSIFYFITAILDFSITMSAYNYYGELFFQMELNPFIYDLLKFGIPPIHMFIIPMVLIFVSIYFRILTNEKNAESKIKDRVIWGMGFSTSLMVMVGITHLIGFISWFYHGAF